MVESLASSKHSAGVADFKGFRTVNITASCTMLNNNLTSSNGTYFAIAKNTNSGGQIYFYDSELVANREDTVETKHHIKDGHKSDCMHLKYHKINNNWYLVVCHMGACLIFN